MATFLLEAGHNAAHGSGVRIGASSPGFRSQIPNIDLLGSDGGVTCERGCCTGSLKLRLRSVLCVVSKTSSHAAPSFT